MNARAAIAALSLLLIAAACHRAPAPAQAPLAGARIGGPFTLVDQTGRTVTDRSYAGRYRVIYFGYSYCPDVCPTTLQTLMQGYHTLAKDAPAAAARLVPIFISVDPDRDTPAVLRKYVAAFGPELQGLTGSAAQVAKVAREYAVSYSRQQPAPGADGYLMSHSNIVVLFDPDGRPITTVPTDQGARAVSDTFAQWVR